MTKLIYLTDSYQKKHSAQIVSIKQKGKQTELILDETIFYPQGGGQPSDKGLIKGKKGTFEVTHVRLQQDQAIHEGKLIGVFREKEKVDIEIDWPLRFTHMCWHSAGHIMHEVIAQLIPGILPIKGMHSPSGAYIEYNGTINAKLAQTIEKQTNLLIAEDRAIKSEFVSIEELTKRASYVPEKLPKNKPLRIVEIAGFKPIPDGGTQVKATSEVGMFNVTKIEQLDDTVRVYYTVKPPLVETNTPVLKEQEQVTKEPSLNLAIFQSLLLEQQQELIDLIENSTIENLEDLQIKYFGGHGKATQLIKRLTQLPKEARPAAGMLVNEFKTAIDLVFTRKRKSLPNLKESNWFDTSIAGIKPPDGHLHIVSQAISEIIDVFSYLGFTRVRHPEVDWDYYPFESLNMPTNHPARDEWETFFIDSSKFKVSASSADRQSSKFSKIVLTPHTSNGQVREMEKGSLPIRMINIAKCYRRQSDVSHVPMFHQFEGLYVDNNVSIGHLKGVLDYFVKQFFGASRTARIRPFHFQFTEPSFEIDISCGVCNGTARLLNGQDCKLCKEGWLELGGAGMVHPVVLRNGGVDPDIYSGFAFGWGVERTYMMKAGTKLDDIRLLYSNDIRFLEQF